MQCLDKFAIVSLYFNQENHLFTFGCLWLQVCYYFYAYFQVTIFSWNYNLTRVQQLTLFNLHVLNTEIAPLRASCLLYYFVSWANGFRGIIQTSICSLSKIFCGWTLFNVISSLVLTPLLVPISVQSFY